MKEYSSQVKVPTTDRYTRMSKLENAAVSLKLSFAFFWGRGIYWFLVV